MTSTSDSPFSAFKAFAPTAEAFEKIGRAEIPSAAREAVQRSVGEAAKVCNALMSAVREDTQTFFAEVDELTGAKTLADALRIQSDHIRARGEVAAARTTAFVNYLDKLVQDGTSRTKA